MWFLFGAASKKKSIPGGTQIERWCDACRAMRTFYECEIEDKVDVFFVPVLNGKSRGLMCGECGEDVELPPVPKLAAPQRRSFTENEKDDLLAALKRKMSS